MTSECDNSSGGDGFSGGIFAVGIFFVLVPWAMMWAPRGKYPGACVPIFDCVKTSPTIQSAAKLFGLVWLFLMGLFIGQGGGTMSFAWGFVLGIVFCILIYVGAKWYLAQRAGYAFSLGDVLKDVYMGVMFIEETGAKTNPTLAAADSSSPSYSSHLPPTNNPIATPPAPTQAQPVPPGSV